ncbi:MAG: MerR family transcriptional regulator [Proteobacteria bacterium]|nr:MerR family transcriptional regulator [Pseudomonadota bacterium]
MDSKESTYHIGEVAQLLGISSRTIRYYEELGLLSPSRSEGGFRVYSDHDLQLMKIIVRFKDIGMALEEIRALLGLRNGSASRESLDELRGALLLRRREFEEKIAGLRQCMEQIDDVIEQLARCSRCGQPMEKETCSRCLAERGEDISPLLDPLI